MEAATSQARLGHHPSSPHDAEELVDYCWRPGCRKEFRRMAGRGRRQVYCSEICRRKAEKELRQAQSRLVHYEHVVERLRIEVAAYGRPDLDEVGAERLPLSPDARRMAAENAIRRAQGVLTFANPDDLAVQELRMLCEAVAPIVLSG